MSLVAIPNQPIKFWDAFDQAKLNCETFSKQFCLKFKNDDIIRFFVDGSARVGTQLFVNSHFGDGITGWSQADGDGITPQTWFDTTCEGNFAVSSTTSTDTKWIYQNLTVNDEKCYTLCVQTCDGIPTQTTNDLEVGYESGGVWNVLATQENILTGEEYCFELDLSALTTPPYNIGIRIVGGNSFTFFVDSITLTEYDCLIDIVDCDCSTTYESISPSGYNSNSGQYLYEFDADTLGLSDGTYRLKNTDLGCGACFLIDSNLSDCNWLFKIGGNSGTTFNIDWSLLSVDEYLNIRIENAEKRYAGYDDDESEIYRDSSFTNKLVYFNSNKTYDLKLPKIPEYVHDVFAILASGSEYFSINIGSQEKRFRIIPETYDISWSKDSDLATATLKIIEYEQPTMINQNTANMS